LQDYIKELIPQINKLEENKKEKERNEEQKKEIDEERLRL
jgi:hypothetical protein